MPQRKFVSRITRFLHEDIKLFHELATSENPLPPNEQRALERVGYKKGPEDELGWFLRFANMEFEKVSDGELLVTQEDLVVIMKAYAVSNAPDIPTRDEIVHLQTLVRKHLAELADKGISRIPEVSIQQLIMYPKRWFQTLEKQTGKRAPILEDQLDCITLDSPMQYSLLYAMNLVGRLIGKAKGLVTRCPHCKNLFLQGRRNQEYCSRFCQSVAVMQRKRAQEKAIKAKRRTKKDVKKGGSRHGTEGR